MSSPVPTQAGPPRRRLLIVVAAVLAGFEVLSTTVGSVALATTPAMGPGPGATTGIDAGPALVRAAVPAGPWAAASLTAPHADSTVPDADSTVPDADATVPDAGAPAQPSDVRAPSPWLRLSAEEPSALQVARAPAASAALDQLPPVEPAPGADEAPSNPSPADAGDETAAAAGGLAGAGRAAAAVPNRLRIPSLGINQAIRSFPCDRAQPPDNFVYQWGCAGTNNLYLLGHAYSVFAPLHDAYDNGLLRAGMLATFAGSDGTIQTYRVTSWRLVRPDQPAWAIAAQPAPSMTLQTCYGANSELRLVVRLVLVG